MSKRTGIFEVLHGLRGRGRNGRKAWRRGGFSLVEVTLAIGIVAFGVVAVMGVLPLAMVSVREAMDRVTEMNLVREFSGEALHTPYSRLEEWAAAGPRYFDEQGIRCGAEGAHFEVTIEVVAPVFPVAPGMDLGAIPSLASSSRVVRVGILRRPRAAPESDRKTHTLHVANCGY